MVRVVKQKDRNQGSTVQFGRRECRTWNVTLTVHRNKMDPTIINAARALGEVAGRSPPYVDADDLWTGLMRGGTDAVTMYSFGTQLRTNRHSRMSIGKLRAKPIGRNAPAEKEEVWMLYCIMRRRAAPYATVPEDAELVDAGRQQVRRGVKQGLAHHSGHALPEQAAARLAETWD